MKVIGNIRPLIPTNAFIDVVCQLKEKYYFFESREGIVTRFQEVSINTNEINYFESKAEIKIDGEEYLCFIDDQDKIIHGVRSKVKPELLKLVSENTRLNEIAKCEIMGEFSMFQPLKEQLQIMSTNTTDNLFKDKFEYFFDGNEDSDLSKKTFIEKFLKVIDESKENLRNHLTTIEDNIYFGNSKLSLEKFLDLNEQCNLDSKLKNLNYILLETISENENNFFHCLNNKKLYTAATTTKKVFSNDFIESILFRHFYKFSNSEMDESLVIKELFIENKMAELVLKNNHESKDGKIEDIGKKMRSLNEMKNLIINNYK